MGGKKEVHARGAARKFLLPERDLVIGHWSRDQNNELGLILGELLVFLEMCLRRGRILFDECLTKQRGESVALVASDGDEAPGKNLAVVGRASRDRHNALHLRGGGPRTEQIARFARTAGFEKRQKRGAVVEHGAVHLEVRRFRNNVLHKGDLPVTVAAAVMGREPDGRYASR